MKNGVECYKDFFGYFNALKTNCETYQILTNDDEVCIPSLSIILLAVMLHGFFM
jgi:hypothetical protein